MPGGSTLTRGNELFSQVLFLPSVTVPTVGANTSVASPFSVSGLQVGDLVSFNQLSSVTGLSVTNIFVSAANTLTIIWSNATIASIGPTAPQPFLLEVTRPENAVDGGIATLPSSVF